MSVTVGRLFGLHSLSKDENTKIRRIHTHPHHTEWRRSRRVVVVGYIIVWSAQAEGNSMAEPDHAVVNVPNVAPVGVTSTIGPLARQFLEGRNLV